MHPACFVFLITIPAWEMFVKGEFYYLPCLSLSSVTERLQSGWFCGTLFENTAADPLKRTESENRGNGYENAIQTETVLLV